ncbi:MAG: glycosyltransferase family 2 protein [Planctomycetes bacterium]|nr:glycosyltransferase family 2 protein [Planctomycetota bacterium]
MNELVVKLVIGFIPYREVTAKYLPAFLHSLQAQTYRNFRILACDNSENRDNENVVYLKDFPDVIYEWPGVNLGFAGGFNNLISRAKQAGVIYFFALNPDMILEPDAIEKLVAAMDSDAKLGSVCPKIRRWDFADKKKTDLLDTCGLVLKPGLRFVDLGQGQVDKSQFDGANILGPSGAAGMYRLSALEAVKEGDNYFDERMFMYKEDCDLAYRLQLKGYHSRLVSDAVIYHDRTAQGQGEGNLVVAMNRKSKSRRVKEWSFLNQHIIFIKHLPKQDFKNKLAIIWYALKMFIFVLIFEPYLLKQYKALCQLEIRN